MSTSYRPEIDGLRAIAVISVLVYHAELVMGGHRLMPAGFLGVDVFFVISGFLITKILITEVLEGRFSALRFYERRARRILPVLFLVMLCTMPFAWRLMLPPAMIDYAGSLFTSILYASNFWFWSSDSYWGQASALKPLLHTWSLSLEEQFYLLAPWLVLALAKRTRVMAVVLATLTLLSLYLAHKWSYSRAEAAFYLLPARAWELLAGSLLALYTVHAKEQRLSKIWNEILTLSGLILIAASVFVFDSTLRHPSLYTLLPVLGSVLVIANGENTRVAKLITNKPMLWIGLLSYSIYLWHFPIFAFFKVALIDLSNAEKIACIGLSVFLALLSYRFIERPFRDPGKLSARALMVTLVIVGGAMLVFSVWATMSKGLPKRFDDYDNVLSYLDYPYEESFLSHTCFLHPEELIAKTGFENCSYSADQVDGGKPTLFLWGDSNAAHLIPGIRREFESTHRLIIRTVSGCGVFMTEHLPRRPGCNKLNEATLQLILDNPPDFLVIGGWWKPHFVERLRETLKQLKLASVPNVTVVGPVPEWTPSLPAAIFKFREENPEVRRYPEYLADPKHLEIRETDQRMREMVDEVGYHYYSSVQRLCKKEGCLTNIEGNLTQWDYGHLTTHGSRYLVKMMPVER